jgi:YtkA-like
MSKEGAMRRVFLALSLLLLFAPSAHAGGWATVSLSSTPSARQWTVDLTVLQHGQTPLDDLQPVVTISNGATTKDFAAKPTGKPGTYRADVVFPSTGRWSYQIDDGFISGMPHTYPPVQIGEAAPAAAGEDGPNLLWLAPGIALLLAAAALLIGPRLSRHPQAA